MLKLVTKLRTPSTTREVIECFSKVLNGNPVACGSRIGRGPDVVFMVSFRTAIMSLVLSFKSWKLNNGIHKFLRHFTHLKSTLHKLISGKSCTPRTQEFDALIACGVVVSSPLANKVCSSSVLKGQKDCGMTTRAPLALVIRLEPNVSPLI